MNTHVLPSVIPNPHYIWIGGDEGVQQLVNRFYQLMDELPGAQVIRALEEQVADATLRQQLTQSFFKTADFLRNL